MHNNKKWSIGIISTYFDLVNERAVVIDGLKELGFEVVAFDDYVFPFDTHKEKNEACLSAFNNVNLAIVIIGDELGFVQSDSVSVTNAEYRHVMNLHKSVYAFVKNNVWCAYLNNDVGIIQGVGKFIKDISDDHGGFLSTFSDATDLMKNIREKLRYYSVSLCIDIAKNQYKRLKNTNTIPTVDSSIARHINNYFVNPRITSSDGEKDVDAEKLYLELDASSFNRHLIIHGDVGSGKSTVLYFNFIHHFDSYRNRECGRIPLFVNLRGFQTDYTVQKYFDDCFEETFNMPIFPLFETRNNCYVLYVDGLDEMRNLQKESDLFSLLKDELCNAPFILACRENYYRRLFYKSRISELFHNVLCVEPWGKLQFNTYLDRFFTYRDKTHFSQLSTWLDVHYAGILHAPLVVVILCYLIYEVSQYSSVDILLDKTLNERLLLKHYTEMFISRELERLGEQYDQEEDNEIKIIERVENTLSDIAWILYRKDGQIAVQDLQDKCVIAEDEFRICSDYLSLREYRGYYVAGTHGYFLEYLISNYILHTFLSSKIADVSIYNHMITPIVNRLVFMGISELSSNIQQELFEELYRQYLYSLSADRDNIIRRTHIVYYLSRIRCEDRDKLLSILNNLEPQVEVRLSLCFGMIKLGNMEIERFLYNILESDLEWNETNRGYHLLYYGDVINKSVPFRDDGCSNWEKTFRSIKDILMNKGSQYTCLTRINLQILRHFIETHDASCVHMEDLDEIEHSPILATIDNRCFYESITSEFNRLKHAFLEASA